MAVFVKVNNPFDRYIKYIDSDGLVLRKGDDTHEFINELFRSLPENYEKETNALKDSNLIFDGIDLTLVQFIKIKLKRGGSYISTSKWISVKKGTINPKNTKDDCCSAYSIIQIEEQNLFHLLKNMIGMVLIFLLNKKIGIDLNEIIKIWH